MKLFLREVGLVALAAALTWWVFLRPQADRSASAQAPLPRTLSVALTPRVEAPPPAPPPPELGAPDGSGEAVATSAPGAESEPGEAEPARTEQLMADAALLASARREFSAEARPGFATVLLASPEEQLDIARFFGEELVLVPRSALDPAARNPTYFRLAPAGADRVEAVAGRAPLEEYRQYRDLFDYEYARLPAPLRELRRSVLARSEVYLFAALIPAREWAVVIGRRGEALARTGRDLADVRRFVLRYVLRSGGGYDLRVEEIVFADGGRHRQPAEGS